MYIVSIDAVVDVTRLQVIFGVFRSTVRSWLVSVRACWVLCLFIFCTKEVCSTLPTALNKIIFDHHASFGVHNKFHNSNRWMWFIV